MTEPRKLNNQQKAESKFYHIRFKGQIGSEWSDWFDGLTISPLPNGEMLLSGEIVDQAALYGILQKAQRLALALISLETVEREETDNEV